MVVFNPPLGTHLTVDLPSTTSSPSSSTPRATITFLADDPEHKVGPDDKVQLWTNAPDESGEKKEWRAVLFEPVEVDNQSYERGETEEAQADETATSIVFQVPSRASLPSSSTTTSPFNSTPDRRRRAILTFPLPEIAGEDSSPDFEYTFRILYPDGNIWWLGGMGVNGTVSFNHGESGASKQEEKEVWDYSGWAGFALQVGQDGLTPIILPLSTTESVDTRLAYLSKDTEDENASGEPSFSQISSGIEDEQVVLLSKNDQHNAIKIDSGKIEFNKTLTEVIRPAAEPGFAEAFAQVSSAAGLGLIPSSSATSRKGQETIVFSQKSASTSKDKSSRVETERWLAASILRKKGMSSSVHRIGIDLSARGLDSSGSGRFALWQNELRRAMLLPGQLASEGDRTVVLDLQGESADRARVGYVDLIPLLEFGSRVGSTGASLGLIGAIEMDEIEWVEEKEWEEVEEYEEEVEKTEEATLVSDTEPRVIPDAKGQQSKVIRRLLDHVIDDIEGGRHGGQSRDQSVRATVGSMSSAASTVTDTELQELREDMLLSPRTVDLHEVEDPTPAREDHSGNETPVGKESKDVSTGGTTTVNTSEDEDEGKQLLPIGSMGSARSGSDAEGDTDEASEGGTMVDPPSSLAKSWRWLVIFFRGFWLRTLGWFRWMFGGANSSADDKPDSEPEVVDESTPLLAKPQNKEQSASHDTVPDVLFAREATPESDTQEQETESSSEIPPSTPLETPAPAIEALPIETSKPRSNQMVRKTRTKTIVEPGYMRLMFAGLQGHVTLLTDITETLKVIHRAAGSEDVTLDVSVKAAEKGALKVLEIDTGDLRDRCELVVLVA